MKALPCLISLSFCFFLPLFSAQGGGLGPLKQQFGQEMRQLQQMVRTGNVDFKIRKNFDESVGATTWDFSRVLANAESVDWAHPSSERLKLSQQIAETIAPYNGLLSSVVFDASAPDSLRAESRNLLKYSQPDTPLLQILRGQIASGSLEQAAEAADLLFEYRSLTDDDKQVALQRSFEAADWGVREGWALELSRFGMDEAIPALEQMLETPLPSAETPGNRRDRALSEYRAAAEAIDYLGPKAKSLRPLLEQRLAEINSGLDESQRSIYAPQLQGAIDEVDGRRAVQIPWAVNGSGYLTGKRAQVSNPRPASSEWAQPPETGSFVASEGSKGKAIPESANGGNATTTKSWSWVVGAFLVIVGGVLIYRLGMR